MEEDRLCPPVSGAEDVAVRESTARGDTLVVGEGDLARDEVRHVDVDGSETGLGEGPRHFNVAVDSLLAEDGDLGTVVERRDLLEERLGDVLSGVEGETVRQTGVLASDVLVLLDGALRRVAEGLHTVRRLGPLLLEGGASRRPEELTAGSDRDGLVLAAAGDATDGVDGVGGEAGAGEGLGEGGDVGLANLEDGSELLVEEGGDGVVVLLERVDHDLSSDATGKGHLGDGGEETSVGTVVVGEDELGVLGADLEEEKKVNSESVRKRRTDNAPSCNPRGKT